MFERKVTKQLEAWKQERGPVRKALLVKGARRVGKSTAIRDFGQREYACFVEIDLRDNKDALRAFAQARSPQDLLNRLVLFAPELPERGDALVFIDGVQELPALTAMVRSLVEDGRYDYVLSGMVSASDFGRDARPASTQGSTVGDGSADFLAELMMRPMDFEEFCWAVGVPREMLDAVQDAFGRLEPIDGLVHDAMMHWFRTYLTVGGMPDVVQRFVDAGTNLAPVRQLQQALVHQYEHDIAKRAGSRAAHVQGVFAQIPPQLQGRKRRFLINSVNPNARFERHEQDFTWLVHTGMALKVDLVPEPRGGFAGVRQASKFKLYQSDVGMLVSRYPDSVARAVYLGDCKATLGGVYENAVAQELVAAGLEPFYYQCSSEGEVDFIVESRAGEVVPIVANAGRTPRKHAALDRLLQSEEHGMPFGIVLSRLNVELDLERRVCYLPFYMTACLGDLVTEG